MASQSGRSSGPFTAPPSTPEVGHHGRRVLVAAPNLPIWFQRFVGSDSSKGHPAHVSSLSGPGTRPGMRPVIRSTTVFGGCSHLPSLSCRLSAAAIRFLAVLFPPQISASLTVGLPAAGQFRWTWTGFPCSALVRRDRCRAPPIPRDRGALMADIETSATTATSQRRVLFLRFCFHLPEFWVTRLAEVHLIRPSGLPLACNLRMERRSSGFLPGFTPRRYQRRMPGAGTSVEHSLGVNRRSFDPPFRLSHSPSATSCRTSISQCPRIHTASSADQGARSPGWLGAVSAAPRPGLSRRR